MDKSTRNKKTALVLGIPSGIVIIGGLLVLVLVHVLMANILGGFTYYKSEPEYTSWPLWVIGLGYIIPGYFGLLSALIQNKGLYIASIVITILLLILMAGVILFVGLFGILFRDISIMINSEDCPELNGVCMCGPYGSFTTTTPSTTCSSYKTVNALSVALSFFIVFTWVSQLVMFIVCCYYTCCAKTECSPGIVITTNQQQPMIVLNQNTSSASAQNLTSTNLP